MEVLLKTFAMYNTQALTIADPRIKKTTQGAQNFVFWSHFECTQACIACFQQEVFQGIPRGVRCLQLHP